MADDQPDKFTLGREQEVEEVLPPLSEGHPKERRRISAGFYVFLVIMVVGMVIAYFDLSRRVNRSQSVGSNQVDNLENRLVKLFDRFTVLEKQLNQNISADQEALKGIETQLKKAREMSAAANKKLSDKANKSEMNTTLSALKKEVTIAGSQADESIKSINDLKKRLEEIVTLSADLEKIRANLANIQEDLTGEINEITLQLDESSKNLIELRSRTAKLAANKIDQAGATNLIKKYLQTGQPSSKQVSATLSDHQILINAVKRQIAELRKDADIYVNEILKIKKQLKAGPPALSGQSSQLPPTPGAAVSSSTPTGNSGDLLQQTLKE